MNPYPLLAAAFVTVALISTRPFNDVVQLGGAIVILTIGGVLGLFLTE